MFHQGDKPAVAHQRPAWLDLANADIEASLLEQFATHVACKVEHAGSADIVGVQRAARKNPLPGSRGERRHLTEQKGAVGRLQCGGGKDIEDADCGTTPIAPRQEACIISRCSSNTRPFHKADRSRCWAAKWRSMSARRVCANGQIHGSTAISTASIAAISTTSNFINGP